MTSTASDLFGQLRRVMDELERLADAVSDTAAGKAASASGHLKDAVSGAKQHINDIEERLRHEAERGAKAADHYVHDNAWTAVVAAAAIAFVLGALSRRRH
jgi:ElaB/YqjD/DUF883 family membrane-anchored ribosome-binding protein